MTDTQKSIIGFLFGCVLGFTIVEVSIHYFERSPTAPVVTDPCPQFSYKDHVIVTEGFYSGAQGIVLAEREIGTFKHPGNSYYVQFFSGTRIITKRSVWIPESQLQLAEIK
jgi:hypothetical protein